MVSILNNVPASDIELITDKPFICVVNGVEIKINPLSLRDYMIVEKIIHKSLWAMYYQKLKWDESLKFELTENISAENAPTLIAIMHSLMVPVRFAKRAKLLIEHNILHFFAPKAWIFTFQAWINNYMSMNDLLECASYFMRYCSEIKKKISKILNQGIGNLTNEKSETMSASIGTDDYISYMSPGPYRYG